MHLMQKISESENHLSLKMAFSITVRKYLLVTLVICSVIICCVSREEDSDYEPQIGALGKHPDKGGSGGKDPGSDKGDNKGPAPSDGGDKDAGSDKGDKDSGSGENDKDPGPSDGGDKDPDDSTGGKDLGSKGDDAVQNDPAHIVANALRCFNAKEVYCSCEESYRLTEKGELHVPQERVEEFCNGPCLSETKLLLNCVEGIMTRFTFFNGATTQDVRDNVLAACSDGEKKGDIDITRNIKEKEGKEGEDEDGDGAKAKAGEGEGGGGGEESMGSKLGAIPIVLGILAAIIAQMFISM